MKDSPKIKSSVGSGGMHTMHIVLSLSLSLHFSLFLSLSIHRTIYLYIARQYRRDPHVAQHQILFCFCRDGGNTFTPERYRLEPN